MRVQQTRSWAAMGGIELCESCSTDTCHRNAGITGLSEVAEDVPAEVAVFIDKCDGDPCMLSTVPGRLAVRRAIDRLPPPNMEELYAT